MSKKLDFKKLAVQLVIEGVSIYFGMPPFVATGACTVGEVGYAYAKQRLDRRKKDKWRKRQEETLQGTHYEKKQGEHEAGEDENGC